MRPNALCSAGAMRSRHETVLARDPFLDLLVGGPLLRWSVAAGAHVVDRPCGCSFVFALIDQTECTTSSARLSAVGYSHAFE